MPIPKDSLFYGLRHTMTEEQEYFANSIIDYNVVFCNSKAGTGKTTIAYASLYYLLELGEIDRIYYLFSPVEERSMGYRPGNQQEKEADYLQPIKDAIVKLNQNPDRALDDKYGWVTARSHTFLRGANFERVGIIIDEAQNYTKGELKKSLTRIHDNCHVVVIGHDGQIDLENPELSGFRAYLEHYEKLTDKVRVCMLTKNFRGWISSHADLI